MFLVNFQAFATFQRLLTLGHGQSLPINLFRACLSCGLHSGETLAVLVVISKTIVTMSITNWGKFLVKSRFSGAASGPPSLPENTRERIILIVIRLQLPVNSLAIHWNPITLAVMKLVAAIQNFGDEVPDENSPMQCISVILGGKKRNPNLGHNFLV